MASDIDSRLKQLRARRSGPPTAIALDEGTSPYGSYFAKAAVDTEDWEKRGAAGQRWTRYAIGAMQAVGKKYTAISVDTGDRVAKQLSWRLANAGILAEFRLQGSVPLDVHIKGVSDVDLLTIDRGFFTYYRTGARALNGAYGRPSIKTSSGVLAYLRQQVELSLENAFPAAEVEKSGAKAVKVSGGSLQRAVDVVPAHWLDTIAYQASGREADRAVTILNKKTGETIDNFPFLHIERVGARCDSIGGGLRKAVRLCKNVKADSDRDISLSSYDIAAIMYHADMTALRIGQYTDLAVLAEAQRHLDALYYDQQTARSLVVPDGSRKIFDSEEKFTGLLLLSFELNELLRNVFRENYPSSDGLNLQQGVMRSMVNLVQV